MSVATALRAARTEVAPMVSMLGPELQYEPDVIRDALCTAVANQGIDPGDVAAYDLAKLERHTMVTFLGGEQRKLLVTGEGPDAEFTIFKQATRQPSDRFDAFKQDMQLTLNTSADIVQEACDSWWESLYWRHKLLASYPPARSSVAEVTDLNDAMRSLSLTIFMGQYAELLRQHETALDALPLPAGTAKASEAPIRAARRLKAAHDLLFILTGKASLHLDEIKASTMINGLLIDIEQNEQGDFRIARDHSPLLASVRRAAWRRAFPHLPDNPTLTLKCPVHAATADGSDTDLQYLLHAAANKGASAEYRIFSTN